MAPNNKLLTKDAGGTPMVARVADAALASRAHTVIAVLGHQADQIEAALAPRFIQTVRAQDYACGLSASLRAGLAALPPETQAALICLGDMPLVTTAMLNQLMRAYDPAVGRVIIVPTCRGQRGNPILWDRRYFPEMSALTGDTGARALLRKYPGAVAEIAINSDATLRDFDTPADLNTSKEGLLF
jgi:molybdenum cofactor cytidylyltransferase